jgi:hypothetical protein
MRGEVIKKNSVLVMKRKSYAKIKTSLGREMGD